MCWKPQRELRHLIGFTLEASVVVEREAGYRTCDRHAAFALLHDVPRFVGEVLLLTGSEVDLVPTRVRERTDRSGLGRVAMHAHICERYS